MKVCRSPRYRNKHLRRGFAKKTLAVVCSGLFLAVSPFASHAQDTGCEAADRLHIVVPSAPGTGVDTTARALGVAMRQEGQMRSVSFENIGGAGGRRAISTFSTTPERYREAILIYSSSVILTELQVEPEFRAADLTPVAGVTIDYQAIAVAPKSGFESFADLTEAYRDPERRVIFGGTAARGQMDHVAAHWFLSAAGENASALRYVNYSNVGRYISAIISGEVDVVTSGVTELYRLSQSHAAVKIIAVAAPERVPLVPDTPTLKELGVDVVFPVSRGFLGVEEMSPACADMRADQLGAILETETWQNDIADRFTMLTHFSPRASFLQDLNTLTGEMRRVLIDLGYITDTPKTDGEAQP